MLPVKIVMYLMISAGYCVVLCSQFYSKDCKLDVFIILAVLGKKALLGWIWMKLYNMLTWPQNPISDDLNFKDLQGKDAPEPPHGTTFSSLYLKHFPKILYPPQYKALGT